MIGHKLTIARILIDRQCKKIIKNNIVTYKLKNLSIGVHKRLSKKIDSFVAAKKYQMLERLIDMYSDMMITNFKES